MLPPAPSDLGQFPWMRILEWSILISFLVGLYWAAKKIVEEKQTFSDTSYPFTWGRLELLIANWWARDNNRFFRADTKYEWEATFQILNTNLTPAEYLKNWELEQKIVFDEFETISSIQSSDLFKLIELNTEIEHFVRQEGTATKDQIERMYVDVVLFRFKNESDLYFASSISSVLNGSLEGPFFEESLKLASFSSKKMS
jgi:hypothetical protein